MALAGLKKIVFATIDVNRRVTLHKKAPAKRDMTESSIAMNHPFKPDYLVFVKVAANGKFTPVGKFKTRKRLPSGWVLQSGKSGEPRAFVAYYDHKVALQIGTRKNSKPPLFGYALKPIPKAETERLTGLLNSRKGKMIAVRRT